MNNLYKVSLKAKKCKLLVIILKKALAYAILFNEINNTSVATKRVHTGGNCQEILDSLQLSELA